MIKLNNIGRSSKNFETIRSAKMKNKAFRRNIYSAKKEYFCNKINNSSNVTRTTWNLINSEVGNKKQVRNVSRLSIGNHVYLCPKKLSNLFNDHFINVVENEIVPKLTKTNSDKLHEFKSEISMNISYFKCEPVDSKEINKIICSFDNKYSTGYDEIPMPIVKQVKKYLVTPLVHLINSSFISGFFPDKLKISKVKPLFKKGEETIMSNYRPLSLLPVFSKIYEKAMYTRLITYFEQNNLMDKQQHGFVQGKSVTTAAVDFIESVVNSIESGKKVVGIFMDLSKAFDSVSHSLLIDKLAELKIKGPTLTWMKSYLTNRQQYVELIHENQNQILPFKSQLKLVKHGIPQGSILGPLLFLCYVKGLPQVISGNKQNKICLYADDANLKICGDSIDEIELSITKNIADLNNHLSKYQLLLNIDKTNFMQIGTVNNKNKKNLRSLSIMLENKQIKEITSTKFLGLVIDSSLGWGLHVDAVAKKVSSGLYALYKLSKLCNIKTLKVVYFAYVHANINFGISIYGATTKKNLDRLLILQKRAVRIMLNLKWRDTVKEQFKNLGIMTVYSMYIYEVIMYCKLNFTELCIVGENHNYDTRGRGNIATPVHRLGFFEKKTTFAGGKFYNKLPDYIKKEQNIIKFKKFLKFYFIHKPLYSIEEYLLG